MVKHTQTTRRQIADELFDHFVGLAAISYSKFILIKRKRNCNCSFINFLLKWQFSSISFGYHFFTAKLDKWMSIFNDVTYSQDLSKLSFRRELGEISLIKLVGLIEKCFEFIDGPRRHIYNTSKYWRWSFLPPKR